MTAITLMWCMVFYPNFLLTICRYLGLCNRFKSKNKLYSVDATVVSLCLSLYPRAAFRRTKGGLKLHTLLDHDGYLPAFVAISPARESDIKKARSLLASGEDRCFK